MAERAIEIEGFDEATQRPVRIQLTLLTHEEERQAERVTIPAGFAAPRGFIPESIRQEMLALRNIGLTSCQAQALRDGGARARSLGIDGDFSAPRGFLPGTLD
ncbi:MAG: hypothetical protein M5U22_21565 [Thermoleophilia bacterium]|nr:hypothetical protein [Thermoleophilia bacterium]